MRILWIVSAIALAGAGCTSTSQMRHTQAAPASSGSEKAKELETLRKENQQLKAKVQALEDQLHHTRSRNTQDKPRESSSLREKEELKSAPALANSEGLRKKQSEIDALSSQAQHVSEDGSKLKTLLNTLKRDAKSD